MKQLSFETKDEWFLARNGKITGTRLKDIIVKRGTGKKIGFYELIAERLAVEPDDEDPMERGNRLQPEAMERFKTETGKKVKEGFYLWLRDDNDSIAVSPDGVIGKKEAVEIKCLSSARHLEAYLTQEVPSEFEDQVIQYFIVNEELEKLYLVFYDPRIPSKDFFYLTIDRKSVEEKVVKYLAYQKQVLTEVETIVNQLSF